METTYHVLHVIEPRSPVRSTFGQCATLDDVLNNRLASMPNGEYDRLVHYSRSDISEINSQAKDWPLVVDGTWLARVASIGQPTGGSERAANNGIIASLPSQTLALRRSQMNDTSYGSAQSVRSFAPISSAEISPRRRSLFSSNGA